MTEQTIAVPIDLIKAGDIDAIKELLPEPDYFGRYATHKKHGRVLVISHHVNSDGEIVYAVLDPKRGYEGEALLVWGKPAELDLEPDVLIGVKELESAPLGTIIDTGSFIAQKWYDPRMTTDYVWHFNNDFRDNEGQTSEYLAEMAKVQEFQCRVVRWGYA